jgi:hypothetical protein
VSSDGTEIVAHVHGRGQPLVLVSGSGDGQNDPFLLPELSEHFTCYSMSLHGSQSHRLCTDVVEHLSLRPLIGVERDTGE